MLLRHLLMAKDRDSRKLETVLVMQGGGSLGAYECGVYKALSKHGKKFDIVAGTSIGAINASINNFCRYVGESQRIYS
jgi:NTE family protein